MQPNPNHFHEDNIEEDAENLVLDMTALEVKEHLLPDLIAASKRRVEGYEYIERNTTTIITRMEAYYMDMYSKLLLALILNNIQFGVIDEE